MRCQLHTALAVEGRSCGRAVFLRTASAEHYVPCGDEAARWQKALEERRLALDRAGKEDPTGIFAVHRQMLDDDLLTGTVQAALEAGKDAVSAVREACTRICRQFEEIDDEYLRARSDDVRDICRGLTEELFRLGGGSPARSPENFPQGPLIVVAPRLEPSDTLGLDYSRVKGFVAREGSLTSHVCIIARSKGIPVLLGIDIDLIREGDSLLLDGDRGVLTVGEEAFGTDSLREETAPPETIPQKVCTADGRSVAVYGNAGSLEDIRSALEAGADGIGLLRTEFLFPGHTTPPSEEEQLEVYRAAAALCKDKPLTVRTFDFGADKPLPWLNLPREDNPFLGQRGIRVCLARPELFRVQLRALLRAAAEGAVRILLPMVTGVEEIARVRALLSECSASLGREGLPYRGDVPLGAMIETPAAALMAAELGREVEFFSIGTNDLTQYLMAADRGNPAVAHLCDPLSEPVLRAIRYVKKVSGVPVGICGEVASDPGATDLLLEAGIDSLSLSAHRRIPQVKRQVQAFRL